MDDRRLDSSPKGILGLAVLLLTPCAFAQTTTLTGSVEIERVGSNRARPANGGIVVWVVPLGESASADTPAHPRRRAVLVQKNKTFTPHLTVISVGSEVDFPNHDPFFHNVFSLFEGKRFDLGLYEAGSTRSVRFDRAGISYLFCNIHSEMSAVIISLDTPYYSISDPAGQITIPDVPPGRYTLHVWREGVSAASLKGLVRTIVVANDSSSFGKIVVPGRGSLPLVHKNKYGQDYESPDPPSLIYERP